jgi:histidinol-phosphate aminotransferase
MNAPTPTPVLPVAAYVEAIAPYIAGRPIADVAREFGLDPARIIKLASNENPLGMPDSARAAMIAACDDAGRYPDGNGFDLKAALAARFNVGQDWITLGNGSNDILVLAAQAFLTPGKSSVFAQYSFVVYALATQAIGARAIVVPATPGLGHDLDAMQKAIAADTQLVFLANPNNPTGTYIEPARIEAFLAAVPAHVVVVLDEAYNEYLAPELRFDSVQWVRRYPNLIISRTFSKAFGLAGLRVGYAIAQARATDILNRIRQPFNVNVMAQAAAVAALNDSAFLAKSYEVNRAGYQQLCAAFESLGLTYIPSCGNFVLVKVGDDDGAGARVNLALLKRGLIVRPVANYGLPRWLRITIGLPEENAALIAALPAALAAPKNG